MILLYLRLALATAVLLAPGWLLARSLGVRRLSATLAWSLVVLFGALGVTFALGSTLPGVSMDAERAARRIVLAIKRREWEPILSLPAQVLARVHGLMPGTVVGTLALVSRLLPRAAGTGETASGLELQRASGAGPLHVATTLGRAAARRFHEYPPTPRTS